MAKVRSRTPQVVGKSTPLGNARMQHPQLSALKCPGCLDRIKYIEESNTFRCYKCGGSFTSAQMDRHVDAMAQETFKRRRIDAANERAEIGAREKRERQAAAEARKIHDTSVVYFIRFRDAVKVGTTGDLSARMNDLPWEEIIGLAPGGIHVEVKHHRNLRPYRIYGEWFELTDEVVEYIHQVNETNAQWYSGVFREAGTLPLRRGTPFPSLVDYPSMT